jgi:hypothetical protein
MQLIKTSSFKNYTISTHEDIVNNSDMIALQKKYPNYKRFDVSAIAITAIK